MWSAYLFFLKIFLDKTSLFKLIFFVYLWSHKKKEEIYTVNCQGNFINREYKTKKNKIWTKNVLIVCFALLHGCIAV